MEAAPKATGGEYVENEERLRKTRLEIPDECLFNDMFLRKVTADEDAAAVVAEAILRALKGNPDLRVVAARGERSGFTEGDREVRLDIWARDTEGTEYDIEIQVDPGRAGYVRAEAHQVAMQSAALERGMKYGDNPTTDVYFITAANLYPTVEGPITRMYVVPGPDRPDGDLPSRVSGRPVETRQIVRYVDGSYTGEDALGGLINDLWCSDWKRIRDPGLKAVMRCAQHPDSEEAKREMKGILQKGIEEARAEFEKEVASRDEVIASRDKEIASYKREIASYKREVASYEKNAENSEQQIAFLQNSVEYLKDQVERQKEQIDKRDAQIAARDEQLTQRAAQVDKHEAQINALVAQMEKLGARGE